MVFWSFWVLSPILAHQTAKFKLSGQFCFSRHPWGPWGRLSSGVICISKIYQLFCDSGAALVDFFKLMKMLPNVSFISMVIKKVFLSVSIATISNFLNKCTLWWHNYETSQPKIGHHWRKTRYIKMRTMLHQKGFEPILSLCKCRFHSSPQSLGIKVRCRQNTFDFE